jgi:hypothetical protein
MTNALSSLGSQGLSPSSGAKNKKWRHWGENLGRKFAVLAATILLAPLVIAQTSPHVTGIDPAEGKVNDSVTVAGENLGKDSVSAVFLSDDKTDYKATLVNQAADKIVIKVPQVKPGDYNASIQVGNRILITPVKFKVLE